MVRWLTIAVDCGIKHIYVDGFDIYISGEVRLDKMIVDLPCVGVGNFIPILVVL